MWGWGLIIGLEGGVWVIREGTARVPPCGLLILLSLKEIWGHIVFCWTAWACSCMCCSTHGSSWCSFGFASGRWRMVQDRSCENEASLGLCRVGIVKLLPLPGTSVLNWGPKRLTLPLWGWAISLCPQVLSYRSQPVGPAQPSSPLLMISVSIAVRVYPAGQGHWKWRANDWWQLCPTLFSLADWVTKKTKRLLRGWEYVFLCPWKDLSELGIYLPSMGPALHREITCVLSVFPFLSEG